MFSDDVLEAICKNVGHIVDLSDLKMELKKAGMRLQYSLLIPKHLKEMLITINYAMAEEIPLQPLQPKPVSSLPTREPQTGGIHPQDLRAEKRINWRINHPASHPPYSGKENQVPEAFGTTNMQNAVQRLNFQEPQSSLIRKESASEVSEETNLGRKKRPRVLPERYRQ